MVYDDYINKRVVVKDTKKSCYRRDNIIDMSGVVQAKIGIDFGK